MFNSMNQILMSYVLLVIVGAWVLYSLQPLTITDILPKVYQHYYGGTPPPQDMNKHRRRVPEFLDDGNRKITRNTVKEFLYDGNRNITRNTVKEFLVPNKVHYIWYASEVKTFTFGQYLSVLSIHKFQKPDGIYFHTNKAPTGPYWDKALKIPEFKVIHRERPRRIFGVDMKEPTFPTSDSDIDRVKILLEDGGIYLDTDVWLIRSLDPLRHFDCTLGAEISDPLLLCGSIILASKDSTFMKVWMEHYLVDYKVDVWAYNSGQVPTKISQQYPDIIHIEMTRLQRPAWNELDYLYGHKSYPWRNNFALHLWNSKRESKRFPRITPNSIKFLQSTRGQAARYIYYN